MSAIRRGGGDPRSTPKSVTAGFASGGSTMVAHSGGPAAGDVSASPRPQQDISAGTTRLFFTIGNAIKAVPWLLLVGPTADVWTLMAVCLLAVPRRHGSLDRR